MNKEHLHPDGRPYTKEEFVEKIKTDRSFAKRFANLGPVYGKQWRHWKTPYIKPKNKVLIKPRNGWPDFSYIDQIANLINDLKTNPNSRRMVVSAWAVHDLPNMVLPPCHYGFQVYTRELSIEERENIFYEKYKGNVLLDYEMLMLDSCNIPKRTISLMYNARSQDVPLGTPFNIASYGLLLEIIAKMVNMVPDELIANMGDCHIYLNQIDGIKEQLTREPYELPKLVHLKADDFYKALSEDLSLLTHLDPLDFQVEGYESHPTIKIPLSN